jgi:hypothetical protein
MSKASVQRILSLIPDRIARSQSGLAFVAGESACAFPERLAFLAERLHWLSPLEPIDSEARRLLGFGAAAARPADALSEASSEEEEDEADVSELDTEPLDTDPREEGGRALDVPV